MKKETKKRNIVVNEGGHYYEIEFKSWEHGKPRTVAINKRNLYKTKTTVHFRKNNLKN